MDFKHFQGQILFADLALCGLIKGWPPECVVTLLCNLQPEKPSTHSAALHSFLLNKYLKGMVLLVQGALLLSGHTDLG